MYCIDSDTNDPYFNLALEELLLKKSTEEFFILCVNSTSVISGKHQCVHREVNTKFVTENNIPVIRRITGGGTVFHDAGNLNFCFIRNCEPGRQINFLRHTRHIIDFLRAAGIDAVLEGTDIKTGGLKISGNSEHVYRNRVLHHGTLLWDASIDTLRNCIRRDTSSYRTRAIASRPSEVTNLAGMLSCFTSLSEFKAALLDHVMEKEFQSTLYLPAESEIKAAGELSMKYMTWEWNHAYGPEYEFRSTFIFREKKVICELSVKDGIIRSCYLDNNDLKKVSERLVGNRHMPEDVRAMLKSEDLDDVDEFVFF